MERMLFRTSLQDSIEYYQKGRSSYNEPQTVFSCKDLFPSQTKSPAICISFKLKMATTRLFVYPVLADAANSLLVGSKLNVFLLEIFAICFRPLYVAKATAYDTFHCSRLLAALSPIFQFLWSFVFSNSLLQADEST